MSNPVVLSVNGRSGSDVAGSGAVDNSQALTWASAINIHGSDGADANTPIRGEPAGILAVELNICESDPEKFFVKTLGQHPASSNAKATEVKPQRNLVLQAIGGNGEHGRRGGDGQNGRDGLSGANATKVQDATRGTDGGNGGNAGSGTDGAHGGNGGVVQIHVNEDQTHLLIATSWDIRGGQGGAAGVNGIPGKGGKGGSGGLGFTWQEHTGNQYVCTEHCEGRESPTVSTSTALVRAQDPRSAMMGQMATSLVASSAMRSMVRAAQTRALNDVLRSTGRCICSGGTDHCLGCQEIPIYSTRTRGIGQCGTDGQDGISVTAQLFAGIPGTDGEALIIVSCVNGKEQRYSSRYRLELVDFELEDENEDGVFEPGEHIFIRRIRVKNGGGMPSPKHPILLQINPSAGIVPVLGEAGQAFIPQILAGQTVTLEGSIKARIQELKKPITSHNSYRERLSVTLRSTMLGLNRRLEHFDFQKEVEIQYPLELQDFRFLKVVAQGSQNTLTMQVKNKSLRSFGGTSTYPRRAEIRLTMPNETGTVLASSGVWATKTTKKLAEIKPNESLDVQNTYRVAITAPDHSQKSIRVELYVSPPIARSEGQDNSMRASILIQAFALKIQISVGHIHDNEADVLVVTNSKTRQDQFEAIGDFIRQELGLKMDVWNISLYGGLQPVKEEDSDEENQIKNILLAYRGKTIILLGNRFDHFGYEQKTILDLCDSHTISNECFAGSSCLLMGVENPDHCDQWLERAIYPVSGAVADSKDLFTKSTTYENEIKLSDSITQKDASGSPDVQLYRVQVLPKWYLPRNMTVNRQAKRVQLHLQQRLPQERFWICPIYPVEKGGHDRYVAVFRGLPHSSVLLTTEPRALLSVPGSPSKLHPFDSYAIVCSLPISLRLDIFCSSQDKSEANDEEVTEGKEQEYSIDESMIRSTEALEAIKLSLQEDISCEIQSYLSRAPLMNNIPLSGKSNSAEEFQMQLPYLSSFLRRLEFGQPSESSLDVLRLVLAASYPQKKKHVAREYLLPFGQRRSHLRAYVLGRINTLLKSKNFSDADIQKFHQSTKPLHGTGERNTAKIVQEQSRKFTKCSEHEYRYSRQTTRQLVPRTECCTASEWDTRQQILRKAKEEIEEITEVARKKREEMEGL